MEKAYKDLSADELLESRIFKSTVDRMNKATKYDYTYLKARDMMTCDFCKGSHRDKDGVLRVREAVMCVENYFKRGENERGSKNRTGPDSGESRKFIRRRKT